MTATPIMPFAAEVSFTDNSGAKSWRACEVVAISNNSMGHGQFTILVEDDDGMLRPQTVYSVRRLAA